MIHIEVRFEKEAEFREWFKGIEAEICSQLFVREFEAINVCGISFLSAVCSFYVQIELCDLSLVDELRKRFTIYNGTITSC